jgi:hypothetical protein
MAEHEKEAKANTEELVEVQARRKKAGLESEQAKARMMKHTEDDGTSIKAVLQQPSEDQDIHGR